MDVVAAALEKSFGFTRFRTGQRDIVDAILAGRQTLAVMPTGAGKSLCYQLPAMLLPGVTLVVSPLIALMKDQVDALRARGVAAAYINSTLDLAEQRQTMDDALAGRLKLLYVAPERFRNNAAMAAIKRLDLGLLAIDEAHCISSWGHDFRPDYMTLGRVAQELSVPRIAAFTATATKMVQVDIVRALGLRDPVVKVAGFLRDNLHLEVVPIKRMREKRLHLKRIVAASAGSTIVYCATRKKCEEVAGFLVTDGVPAMVYHGGLDDESRRVSQETFQSRDDAVIVATNAFGMGVDKANVRAVVHWDIPGTVDAYYQEAGRAGRDGRPAACYLLYTYADTRVQEFFIDNGGEGLPAEERAAWAERERAKLRTMVRYAYEEGCRHATILRYFGDVPSDCRSLEGDPAPSCDNCKGARMSATEAARKGRDAPDAARRTPRVPARRLSEAEEVVVQKVLSAVARANGQHSARELAGVLRGSRGRDALQSPLASSKSYGILAGMKASDLVGVLNGLERAGCTTGRRPRLTDRGVEVMWRRAAVELDVPAFEERPGRGGVASAPEVALGPEEEERLRRLKQRRVETAKARGVPAYVVATNRVLAQVAQLPPEADRDAWLALHGVGEASVDALREVFRETLDETG